MIKIDEKYVRALAKILDDINYSFIIKNLRGSTDFIDPWCDFDQMQTILEDLNIEHSDIIKLLYLGEPTNYNNLIGQSYKKDIDLLIESGILLKEDNILKTNNFVVLLYQGLYILTEINPWYKTCINKNTDVYIGFDSLRLAENIIFDKDSTVLDLCSGTGIQGLLASKSAKKVISVEINEKAAQVAMFNSKLNKVNNIMNIRIGDLYSIVKDEKFDYIYANPPFIPMIEGIEYPICGDGGRDGLIVLNKIFDNLDNYLNENGKSIIFCQCLGDDKNIFFNNKVDELSKNNNWKSTCISTSRMPMKLQIKSLINLTRLFNKDINENEVYNKFSENYSKMGAKYLYTILYQIEKNREYKFTILNLYNDLDLSHKLSVKSNVNIRKDDDSYIIIKENKKIGYFDEEALDIYNEIKSNENMDLYGISRVLFNKYKNKEKYKEYGLASFESEILDSCFKMKKLGLLDKK